MLYIERKGALGTGFGALRIGASLRNGSLVPDEIDSAPAGVAPVAWVGLKGATVMDAAYACQTIQ